MIKKAINYLIETKTVPSVCFEISLLLVNDKKMMELNRQYRGIDKTTDVLSFPQITKFKNFKHLTALGDIVINIHLAKRHAKEHGMTFYEELNWLLIHGILHLFGYDHEKNKYQAKKMRMLEIKLLEAINPKSAIGCKS